MEGDQVGLLFIGTSRGLVISFAPNFIFPNPFVCLSKGTLCQDWKESESQDWKESEVNSQIDDSERIGNHSCIRVGPPHKRRIDQSSDYNTRLGKEKGLDKFVAFLP
jgi:hypothetical protein